MKDYTSRAAAAIGLLLVAVVLLGAIPPFQLFGLELRRVDMLSLFESDYSLLNEAECEGVFIDNVEYEFDIESINSMLEESAGIDSKEGISYSWIIDSVEVVVDVDLERVVKSCPTPLIADGAVPIEDFDTTNLKLLDKFYHKLLHSDSLTRIAVMGDSFIEGDILTGDLREMMQLRYGGVGSGFAPVSSPLTKFRRTVSTTSKSWKSNNVMQRKSASASDVDMFTISGWLSRPSLSSGASVEWKMVTAKRGNQVARSAKLLFVAQRDSRVEVEVNGEHSRRFSFEASEYLRHIDIQADSIYSLKLTVLSGGEGFAGYGAIFDGGSGVCVDNYSVRSNSGQAMFWSNASLNAQIGHAIGGYDLVILQYGLNIMAQDVYNYDSYALRLKDMVEYVRGCFPGAAVMIMGVSERYVKSGEGYSAMNSIEQFSQMQRSVAQDMGTAFWATKDAFTIRGGMRHFVEQGWAGKDYTHINFNGGREVGHTLFDAIALAGWEYSQRVVVDDEKFELVIPDDIEIDSVEFDSNLSIKPLYNNNLPRKSVGDKPTHRLRDRR
ncbi:MAG: hypothetical protein SNJ33_04155 [Rikenellaceae bacterium]